jgi:hypothetical protein
MTVHLKTTVLECKKYQIFPNHVSADSRVVEQSNALTFWLPFKLTHKLNMKLVS